MDELDPFFKNETRASEWRTLRIALLRRLAALETGLENAADEEERKRLSSEIKTLHKQVDTLLVEEVSQQFAEDAVRMVIVSRVQRGENDENDEEEA